VIDQNREAAPDLLPDSWSTKEVVADLKHDILGRFDKQDATLQDIARSVDGKADKADVQVLAAEHRTLADRLLVLETWRLQSARLRNTALICMGIGATVLGGLLGGHVI
jgi:hypothetical protein